MHSMTQEHTLVVGGVDSHADTHHVAALDQRGALLATKSFPTTTPGYRQLLDWLSGFGELDVVAVESTGSYAAALVRYLREHGVQVFEVNQPHAHTRRRVGKSDPIDAEMAARLFLAGKAKSGPEADRRDRRVDPAAARRARQRGEVPQRRDRPAPRPDHHRPARAPRPALPPQDASRQSRRLRAIPTTAQRACAPSQAAKFALRSIAQRIDALDDEIAALDRELEQLVRAAAPRTTQLLGSRPATPADCSSPPDRTSTASAARAHSPLLCGASPIPASSGKTTRHRLNYGGDRQANRALHLIAVCRLRYCQRTRAYAQRRTAEGKTKLEILRCLKRYIARELYNTLRADLADTRPAAASPRHNDHLRHPGFGINRHRT